jgi:hypothetical protein
MTNRKLNLFEPIGTAKTVDGRAVVLAVLPTGVIVPLIQKAAK